MQMQWKPGFISQPAELYENAIFFSKESIEIRQILLIQADGVPDYTLMMMAQKLSMMFEIQILAL